MRLRTAWRIGVLVGVGIAGAEFAYFTGRRLHLQAVLELAHKLDSFAAYREAAG